VTDGNWLAAADLAKQGIYLYHFSLVFPSQVLKKSKGYAEGVSPRVDNSHMTGRKADYQKSLSGS
jgi:hypothetical protein